MRKSKKKKHDDLAFQIWLVIWCASHPVGYKEVIDGNEWARTEDGYSILWNKPISYVTVTGRLEVK